ncbi:MAG: flagellar hook assembly protein FlgD [Gallionellaceae bacterium]|nr:flagellar hook assembly protein FlgD [Gallionellaceae bacterium]
MAVAAANTDYSSVIASVNGKSATTNATQEMSDRFLKLLVTQLKNQDPMNPMDNAEMTSQLAQMSTVEGINRLNDSMAGLLSSYQAAQTLQATALLGHQVLAEGDVLNLSSGVAVGGADLASAVDSVTVTISDHAGQVLDTLRLGAQPAGELRFAWDGTDANGNALADGKYNFTVSAKTAGETVAATSLTLAPVSSVSMQNGTVSLELSGLGERTLNQIRQIF